VKAIEAIQQFVPQLPIIITSGVQVSPERMKRIDASHVTALNKPYGVEQLLDAIGRILGS
jgi:DNA-binding NtrC family response regulator